MAELQKERERREELEKLLLREKKEQENELERTLNEEKEKFTTLERSFVEEKNNCLLYTSPSPRDKRQSRMPSSA